MRNERPRGCGGDGKFQEWATALATRTMMRPNAERTAAVLLDTHEKRQTAEVFFQEAVSR